MEFEGGGAFRMDGSLCVCQCVLGRWYGENSRERQGEAQRGWEWEEGIMGGADQPKSTSTMLLRLTAEALYIIHSMSIYILLFSILQYFWGNDII